MSDKRYADKPCQLCGSHGLCNRDNTQALFTGVVGPLVSVSYQLWILA